jgi:hypothetical protein
MGGAIPTSCGGESSHLSIEPARCLTHAHSIALPEPGVGGIPRHDDMIFGMGLLCRFDVVDTDVAAAEPVVRQLAAFMHEHHRYAVDDELPVALGAHPSREALDVGDVIRRLRDERARRFLPERALADRRAQMRPLPMVGRRDASRADRSGGRHRSA